MIFSSSFAWDAQCLLLKGAWRKTVSEVRFGETFHKSITLSLEQSPYKYLEMGMNVGGVNREGNKCNGDSLVEAHW